jgi:3-hydroxyisobutyrate dehydrogenase-like beta-hydroxyacid dehydrogenase
MKQKIGFIGVGLMGEGMATGIVKAGYPLTIMGNRNRAPVERLIALGAHEATNAKEVASRSDIVFLCVTGTPEVEALVKGLVEGAKKGLIIIDCSTAEPASTLRLHEELKPLGITFIDCPLNGTPTQAQVQQLSAMVGCDDALFTTLEPIIRTWAAKVVCLGEVGRGHKIKILNNFIAMGYAALYSEALSVAEKNGITPQMFDSVLRGSRMDCGFYQTYFDYVLNGNDKAHLFTLKNGHKDVNYLASMAQKSGIANPLGAAVNNYYALAENSGNGEKYVPMLYDVVRKSNGLA